jgi:hypothetical protein
MQKLKAREIVASTDVHIENKTKGTKKVMKEQEEYLPTEPIEQDAAFVSVKAGATVKLHDFNMGRIDVSLMYPCKPEQINDVYEKVKDWVDTRLSKEVQDLRKVSESMQSKKVDI